MKLGLFDALRDGSLELRDLARAIGLREDRAEKLVTACAALGLVERPPGRVIQQPHPSPRSPKARTPRTRSRGASASKPKPWNGCSSSARRSIAACERNSKLRTVVMDFPNVLTVTRELVARHGLEDRIETRPGRRAPWIRPS